jgi:hypothetical protein
MGREHLSYYPDNCGDAEICDRGGNAVARMTHSFADQEAGRRPKYHVHERDWSMDELGCLFAAAPELHEALKWALPWIKNLNAGASQDERENMVRMIEAAISKAEALPEPIEIRDPTEYP